MGLEAPVVPWGLQQQQMATGDKSGDTDPLRIPSITSEVSNLRTGYHPIRNSETSPCLLFSFYFYSIDNNIRSERPMFVQQQREVERSGLRTALHRSSQT